MKITNIEYIYKDFPVGNEVHLARLVETVVSFEIEEIKLVGKISIPGDEYLSNDLLEDEIIDYLRRVGKSYNSCLIE